MTAKEYLEQSRVIRLEILWINRQIEEIETSLGPHPIQLDDSGASKSNYHEDDMSERLSKVGDLYTELTDRKAKLILKNEEIHNAIATSGLKTSYQNVLNLRYLTINPRRPISPLGWKSIGFRMGISAEAARKMHIRALKEFSTKL